MAKPLRPKRGTTAKNDAFVGLASEITVDTEKHSIRVHDSVTAGGHEILPKEKNDELYAPKDLDVGVTSVNGNKGALTSEQTGCLPLSGGTMTGTVTFTVPAVINQATATSYTTIRGGTTNSDGARLVLTSKGDSDTGAFKLYAQDGTNSPYLVGKANGALTWGGKEVERVNSSGDGWIRYESGKLIAKGSITCSTANAVTKYTLLSPFKDKNYRVAFGVQGASGSTAYAQVKRIYTDSTASVLAVQSSVGGVTVEFVAFGEWK